MGLIKTEEEIEEWYQEARKRLDEEYENIANLTAMKDEKKAEYKVKLHALRKRYETYHHKLKRRDKRKERILRSKILKFYFKLEWKLLLLKEKLRKEEPSDSKKSVHESFIFYLNDRLGL